VSSWPVKGSTRLPSSPRADRVEKVGRSARKRASILRAATDVFLKGGYLGTNVDAIAAGSGVSKQTVYKHFGSKEVLFVEIVASMTSTAGDLVVGETPEPDASTDLSEYLRAYAETQLTVVLTPRLMQLRRLVIGEVSRFPDLAKVLYERGPQRAMTRLTALFERLAARGLLTVDDPSVAASHFNWLIMADPLNRAMLLGDQAIPAPDALGRHVAEGVRVFLAAYAARPARKHQVKAAGRSRRRSGA
jgi:TetR/AcrR family transcriptional regulator, mexJK operon transcriptional repressor